MVIIGAGQAGLSVAYYLRSAGLVAGTDFVIFDRGPRPGGAWQHRWPALTLGTTHRVNDLPGLAELGLSFATADRSRPASEVVTEYYRRYEEHFGLAVVRPVTVTAVGTRDDGLMIDTTSELYGNHRTDAQALVNATGTWGAPFRPHYPGAESFLGRQVHTSDYRRAEDFAGQNVVVVGGGTSAIGFLLELDTVAAGLQWATRRPVCVGPMTASARPTCCSGPPDFAPRCAISPRSGCANRRVVCGWRPGHPSLIHESSSPVTDRRRARSGPPGRPDARRGPCSTCSRRYTPVKKPS